MATRKKTTPKTTSAYEPEAYYKVKLLQPHRRNAVQVLKAESEYKMKGWVVAEIPPHKIGYVEKAKSKVVGKD